MTTGTRTAAPKVKRPKESAWEEYVAEWPAWRDFEACQGKCLTAVICGRARVCVRDAHVPARVTYALARLSAQVGERPPARTL
jgi:hypothetical protein